MKRPRPSQPNTLAEDCNTVDKTVASPSLANLHPSMRNAVQTLMAKGKLHPAIADTASLADAADVHRRIDKAEIAGKVVLLCHP